MGTRADDPSSGVVSDEGPFRPGDECEGRYRIVSRLKAGGVGVVYEAEHAFTGLRVALKALYNRAGDHHERMRLEARALADIRHPNVVQVTDGGVTSDGVVWFTMELLQGSTLRQEIWHKGSLGVERALRFGIQIARGVEAAHASGVIHRDLKPENVFVVQPEDTIRVLDFGTSKFQRSQLKTTDRFRQLGTHAYMSPERLQAATADARADVYALGHILYEMLTGMHALSVGPGPLDFPPPYELGLHQIYAPVRPVSERVSGVPEYVAAIAHRALEKDRKARQQSMRELAEEMERALARFRSEPAPAIVARRQSVPPPPADLATDRVAVAALPDALTTSEQGARARLRRTDLVAIETELVSGAARFACSPGQKSEIEAAFARLAFGLPKDSKRLLQAAVLVAGRASDNARRLFRQRLLDWSHASDATRVGAEAQVASLVRQHGGAASLAATESDLAAIALGAARLLEPEVKLDAAESALVALEHVAEDVRQFAFSVLVAFARAELGEQAAGRGALLALLLGSPEDTELARAELAELVVATADRWRAQSTPEAAPALTAPASALTAPEPAQPAAPAVSTPEPAQPAAPAIAPREPPRARAVVAPAPAISTRRARPSALVAAGLGAIASGVVIAAFLALERPSATDARAPEPKPKPAAAPVAPLTSISPVLEPEALAPPPATALVPAPPPATPSAAPRRPAAPATKPAQKPQPAAPRTEDGRALPGSGL